MANRPLDRKRILVVEDEYLMANELCDNLKKAGAMVIGPAPSVQQALSLVEHELPMDAALLDVNLGGEKAFPVADALIARSVPFVFTSGYDDEVLAKNYALMPRCQKPTPFALILRELVDLLPL